MVPKSNVDESVIETRVMMLKSEDVPGLSSVASSRSDRRKAIIAAHSKRLRLLDLDTSDLVNSMTDQLARSSISSSLSSSVSTSAPEARDYHLRAGKGSTPLQGFVFSSNPMNHVNMPKTESKTNSTNGVGAHQQANHFLPRKRKIGVKIGTSLVVWFGFSKDARLFFTITSVLKFYNSRKIITCFRKRVKKDGKSPV